LIINPKGRGKGDPIVSNIGSHQEKETVKGGILQGVSPTEGKITVSSGQKKKKKNDPLIPPYRADDKIAFSLRTKSPKKCGTRHRVLTGEGLG